MEIEKNSRNFLDSAEAERRKRPLSLRLHSGLIFGFPVSRVRKANYNRASVTMVYYIDFSFNYIACVYSNFRDIQYILRNTFPQNQCYSKKRYIYK